MNSIIESYKLKTGHRMPQKVIQKIALYAVSYNENYNKLHKELLERFEIKKLIKKLDDAYFSERNILLNPKGAIELLKKCTCCKTHMTENQTMIPLLTRQNACKHPRVCTCGCAFYIKELILL